MTIANRIAKKSNKAMFLKKPKVDEKGNYIFKKHIMIPMLGILLIIIFSLVFIFKDYYIAEITKEEALTSDQSKWLAFSIYGVSFFMILAGLKIIISGFFHKIILSSNRITRINSFMKKKNSVDLNELTELKLSRQDYIIFKDKKDTVKFNLIYGGYVELIEFFEKNFPPEKNEEIIKVLKKRIDRVL